MLRRSLQSINGPVSISELLIEQVTFSDEGDHRLAALGQQMATLARPVGDALDALLQALLVRLFATRSSKGWVRKRAKKGKSDTRSRARAHTHQH